MTNEEYTVQALKTLNPNLTEIELKAMLSLGLCGESGEVADIFKKHICHNKPLDNDKLVDELGDILWYFVLTCELIAKVPLSEVMKRNIDKLSKRHSNGFTSTYHSDSGYSTKE